MNRIGFYAFQWVAFGCVFTAPLLGADVELRISGKETPLVVGGGGVRSLRVNIDSQIALGDVEVSVELRPYGDNGNDGAVLEEVAARGGVTETIRGGGGAAEVHFSAPGSGLYELAAKAVAEDGGILDTYRTTFAVLPALPGGAALDLDRLPRPIDPLARKRVPAQQAKEWTEAKHQVSQWLDPSLTEAPGKPSLRSDYSPTPEYVAVQVLTHTLGKRSFEEVLTSGEPSVRILRWGTKGDEVFVVLPVVSHAAEKKEITVNLPAGLYRVRDWQGREREVTVPKKGWSTLSNFLVQYWTLKK